MATNHDVSDIKNNVNDLQKDMAQVGLLVERLDITIEKLTEVSTTVSQVLAVQGNRLEVQEKIQEKLQDVVDQRKRETDDAIKNIYGRIERVQRDLQDDMDNNEDKIIAEIQKISTEIKEDTKKQHEQFGERLNKIEKWMWTLVGGAAVVAVIFNIFVQLVLPLLPA